MPLPTLTDRGRHLVAFLMCLAFLAVLAGGSVLEAVLFA